METILPKLLIALIGGAAIKGISDGSGVGKTVWGKFLEEGLKAAFDLSITQEGFKNKFNIESEFKEFQEELFYRTIFKLIPKVNGTIDNEELGKTLDYLSNIWSKSLRRSLDEANLLQDNSEEP